MNTKDLLYKYNELSFREISKKIDMSIGSISKYAKYEQQTKINVDNAIIFAAGIGSRLRPLTNEMPKPLLKIGESSFIETSIDALLSNGIENIYVVVGYLEDKFKELKKQYPMIKLIVNKNYSAYNNIESLFVAKEVLGNTLLIEGDIYWRDDVLSSYYSGDTMYSYKLPTDMNEWIFNKTKGKIKNTTKGGVKGDDAWTGVSFITKDTGTKIKKYFDNDYNKEVDGSLFYEQLFWKIGIEFNNIRINKVVFDEVDTLDEYNQLNNSHQEPMLKSPKNIISYFMNIDEGKIESIHPVKGGLTNDTYSFRVGGEKYILRSTRDDTNKNINRYVEYDILEIIKHQDFSVEKIFFSQTSGIAIFRFVEHDSFFEGEEKQITEIAKNIKSLHNIGVQGVPELRFNKLISEYTNNIKFNPFFFEGIESHIDNAMELFGQDSIMSSLCHNDLLSSNILFANEQAKIIDWEFSSLNDKYWDLASLVSENNLTEKQIILFEKTYGTMDREKLNIFIYIVSVFWVAWCFQHENQTVGLKKYFKNKLAIVEEYYEIIK